MNRDRKLDFGYSWVWTWGHGILALVFLAAGTGFFSLGAPRWSVVLSTIAALWASIGFFLTQFVFRAHEPLTLPTDQFMASGAGNVLDLGCGSGRTSIMVGSARPEAAITGVDNFSAAYIKDHGQDRLFRNLRIAGVADRVTFQQGDMLDLPFENDRFDAAVSTYAMDHLGTNIPKALEEACRVLKPGGQLLLMVILPTVATAFAYLGTVCFVFPTRNTWYSYFSKTGFTILTEGKNTTGGWFLLKKA